MVGEFEALVHECAFIQNLGTIGRQLVVVVIKAIGQLKHIFRFSTEVEEIIRTGIKWACHNGREAFIRESLFVVKKASELGELVAIWAVLAYLRHTMAKGATLNSIFVAGFDLIIFAIIALMIIVVITAIVIVMAVVIVCASAEEETQKDDFGKHIWFA